MSIERKKQHYLNAKAIKGSSNYSINRQGVSLPYKIHFFAHPPKKLHCTVDNFCARSDRDELFLVDTLGDIWRYYSDIDSLQKTNFSLNEKFYSIESIGEILIVQYEKRIEARALSTGQIIWSKNILPQTFLRKKNQTSLILYESTNSKAIILNSGGEVLFEENYQAEEFNLSSNEILVDTENLSREEKALLVFDRKLNKNRVSIYTLKEKKWKLKESLNLKINDILFIRHDTQGRIWYLNKNGQIGYLKKNCQYIKTETPLNPSINSLQCTTNDKCYDVCYPLNLCIDSLKQNTRWHKILMEYTIPAECDIRMEVTSSNNKDKDKEYIIIKQINTDLLLPELEGQYLFIKIYLIGNQTYQESPIIHNIKVIYPRSTYLEHLPTYYQEDKESAIILEKFLSIFETTFSTLEQQRASTPSLITSSETSKKHLAWLSKWLGLTYDESWDENRWRILLHEAPKLFDIRGTRESIERVIEIYSDMRPIIQEPIHTHCLVQWKIAKNIDYKKWKKFDKNEYKKIVLKKIDNYSFCVFLKPEQYTNQNEVKTIKRIVEEWKPAYTKAHVLPLEHRMLLGSFVFLGINSKLEKSNSYLGIARMPFNGLAPAREEDIKTIEQVRINHDAILN